MTGTLGGGQTPSDDVNDADCLRRAGSRRGTRRYIGADGAFKRLPRRLFRGGQSTGTPFHPHRVTCNEGAHGSRQGPCSPTPVSSPICPDLPI